MLTAFFMAFFGVIGMVAFAHFGIEGLVAVGENNDYLAFLAAFFLMGALAPFWQALAIILAVMLVASSADTIQTGVSALLKPMTEKAIDAVRPKARSPRLVVGTNLVLSLVFINIPAIALAMANISVLSLFVLADLVAATAVAPVLMGMSPRIHPVSAGAGCVAGLLLAIVIMSIGMPSVYTGLSENIDPATGEFYPMRMLFDPAGLYSETSLLAFIAVPIFSAMVTLLVNIPFHLQGYRFAGFKREEETAKSAAAPATGKSAEGASADVGL